MEPATPSLGDLREENENLRKEVEALLRAREIAKDKVRRAIQELVDENRRLRAKIILMEKDRQEDPEKPDKMETDKPVDQLEIDGMDDELDSVEPAGAGDYDDDEPKPVPSGRAFMKVSHLLGIEEKEAMDAAIEAYTLGLTIDKPGIAMMKNPTGNTIEIRGGVLEKLAKRLHHKNTPTQSPDYVTTFVLTHTSFATTAAVLQLLMKNYLLLSNEAGKNPTVLRLKRRRILEVLLIWVELQPEHFYGEGLDEFKNFVKTVMLEKDGNKAKPLYKKISKTDINPEVIALKMDAKRRALRDKGPYSKTIMPRASRITSIEDVGVVELARQLTLIDYELFQRIRISEYIGLAWTKSNKDQTSANLLRVSQRFNEVSRWIQYQIVSCTSLKRRAAVYQFFVKLGQEFRKLKNYNGIMQITSALEAASVHRLTKNMERCLSASTVRKYRDLHELMSPASAYKNYRDALAHCDAPCVPYMGVWQTDLTAIEESHKKTLEPQYPDYINIGKHTMIARIMRKIIEFQKGDYALHPVSMIREWVESQISKYGEQYDDDKLYDLSLEAEPRAT